VGAPDSEAEVQAGGDGDAHGAEALQDADAEDETINDSHYQRGKRFRKLHRLMASPVVGACPKPPVLCVLSAPELWLSIA
jgi:hypothetical protein